jgi:L-seryl-tRNA(Ser) seleniumtransferase
VTADEIAERAGRIIRELGKTKPSSGLTAELVDGLSRRRTERPPDKQPPTKLIAWPCKQILVRLEQALRRSNPPVVARIVDDRVMLDLRTVPETDERALLDALCGVS